MISYLRRWWQWLRSGEPATMSSGWCVQQELRQSHQQNDWWRS